MLMSKSSKMLQFINYRMGIAIQDGRQLVGKFMAFDRHMNLVIRDCEEFRKLPPAKGATKNEERDDRCTLGLVLLSGEEVISMTVEDPPPPDENRAKAVGAAALAGLGLGRAAGRGIPIVPLIQDQPRLAGPVWAVGGPAPGAGDPTRKNIVSWTRFSSDATWTAFADAASVYATAAWSVFDASARAVWTKTYGSTASDDERSATPRGSSTARYAFSASTRSAWNAAAW